MPVVFLIAIVVVLVAIFFAATGRGGELAYEHADHAPLDLGPVSSADVALLRPPTALWGYNMQVTDAALDQIARAMRERDVTIAYLQEQLAGYERTGSGAEPRGAHARPGPDAPDAPDAGAPEPAGPPQPGPAAEPHDPTRPSATMDPDAPSAEDGPGPQSAFDTHGWWAEQREAAREEQARRRAEPGQDDDMAAVEEQGW